MIKIKEEAEVGKFYRSVFLRSQILCLNEGDPKPQNYYNDDNNLHMHSTFALLVYFYMYCFFSPILFLFT